MVRKKHALQVEELFKKHIHLVKDTIESMVEVLRQYSAGNYEKARDRAYNVHLRESDADTVRRSLIETIYTGSFMPMVREDFIKYLSKQDKIADHAESVCDFIVTQRPKIPPDLCVELVRAAEGSKEALEHLRMAVKSFFTDFSTISEYIKKVNSAEEESDSIEWHLTEKIYSSDSLSLEEKLHLNSLVNLIGIIPDTVENAADMLDSMAVTKKV